MKLTIYKFLSIVLAGALLVGGGFFLYEKRSHAKARKELNNRIAKLEKTVQETENAYSRRAIEAVDLESENEELQDIIDDRDEDIVALNQVIIKWKDKYFQIKNAQQSVVDDEGNEIPVDPGCEECFMGKRFRVDFAHQENFLKVKGFTLTNPAYAELVLNWIEDLKLELIVTKDDNDMWRAYVNSSNWPITAEMNIQVDPTVFETKWYEKLGLSTSVGVGPGVQTGVSVFYDVAKDWFVGPLVVFQYDGQKFNTFYGVNVGWYPFR